MARRRKPVFRDGQIHVLEEKCATCIFRPGNPMYLEEGRVKSMVDHCLSEDGGNIPCHSTLDGEQAICAGFFESYADRVALLRKAKDMDAALIELPEQVRERLNVIKYVPVPEKT